MKLADLETLTGRVRSFSPHSYIECKVSRINEFFQKNQLDSCVIGVSGGVDSAVTLGLLLKAQQKSYSPLQVIVPLLMPIRGHGTTGQDEATRLAILQCKSFGLNHKVVDLTGAYQLYLAASGMSDDPSSEVAWANGQLASILRTPCSYYHAALLQAEGYKSIVVGTTNRDEGSYIGFYGKASDAMVDLQPIADIHKSEVRTIAPLLGVIPEIAGRPARGDVWDDRSSEEMMGAPYWFLKMYLLLKQHDLMPLCHELEEDDRKIFNKYMTAIETTHQKNAHKYQVGLPSHFIDCMPREVPGGW